MLSIRKPDVLQSIVWMESACLQLEKTAEWLHVSHNASTFLHITSPLSSLTSATDSLHLWSDFKQAQSWWHCVLSCSRWKDVSPLWTSLVLISLQEYSFIWEVYIGIWHNQWEKLLRWVLTSKRCNDKDKLSQKTSLEAHLGRISTDSVLNQWICGCHN